MKKKIVFLFIFILILFSLVYFKYYNNPIDKKINFLMSQKNIHGFEVSETLFRSPFLIINFWASWCPPCIAETPSLVQFTKDHPDFKLMAISLDEKLTDVQSFTKLFPNFKNDGVEIIFDQSAEISRKFNVEKLPESFIYSFKKNKYVQISGSTNWNDPQLMNFINQQLN